MLDASIQAQVEQLSEALVFAELTDMPALAQLHTQFQELGNWALAADMPMVVSAMEACASCIEKIILEETDEPQALLSGVGEAAGALQAIVRDGRDPAEVAFPAILGLNPPAAPQPKRAVLFDEHREPDTTPAAVASDVSDDIMARAAQAPGASLSSVVDNKILSDFVNRQSNSLEEMESLVLSLEQEPDESKKAELRRYIHTLKGEAGLVGFFDVERVCHLTEDAINEHPINTLTDILLDVKDWLSRVFVFFSGKGELAEPADSLIQRIIDLHGSPDPGSPEEPQAAQHEPAAQAESRYLTGAPDLLCEFVTEALEHLDNADTHLLTVEVEPHNEEALNAVFRAFHTIKGVSGFLDLGDLQSIAHEAENLLDRARKGEAELIGMNMDLTFDAVDMMKRLVQFVADALSSGMPLAMENGLPALIQQMRTAVASSKDAVIAPHPAPAVAPTPAVRVGEILVSSGKVTPIELSEALHAQGEISHQELGELLIKYIVITRSQLDEALQVQREQGGGQRLGDILVSLGMATQADIDRVLRYQKQGALPKIGEILVEQGITAAKDVAQALRAQKQAPHPQQKVEVREAVRIDADRLDRLVDLIGEIVIAESMVSQSPELRARASSALRQHISQLDKITRELQEMGTSLRMVPVRATFQKMARLVRDLAKKANKKVEFEMHGEETELDKSVVDKIGDPLVHMVRNAVDHGLEATPEERIRAGKQEAGMVQLRAFHRGGNIYIEIEDDGLGLDREAIISKAIERGIIRESDSLSDREVWNLIFEPGFSTAKQVTDVSGRGVGMDVVRRNVELLRGQIDIHSERGLGSKFSIRLPLTLAIIDGMVIRVGKERYIIPTLSVVRSVQPAPENLFSVARKGEMLSLQGQLIPLFRLDHLFKIPDAIQDPTQALVIIVEDDGKLAGLLIDELLGQQQIVIKSLGDGLGSIRGVSGGAIMPDGLVGLILDVGGLVRIANSMTEAPGSAPYADVLMVRA